MAEMIEAQGNAFFTKCKGYAVLITAMTGLILGIISQVKEPKDPRVKGSYEELSKQIELLSKDTQRLSEVMQKQQDQIAAIQNYLLRTRDVLLKAKVEAVKEGHGSKLAKSEEVEKVVGAAKSDLKPIEKALKENKGKPVPKPPMRKAIKLEMIQQES